MKRRLIATALYLGLFLFTFDRCVYHDVNDGFSCDTSDLAIGVSSTEDASSCRSIDGVISVIATGGVDPYDYRINGGDYQTNSTFTGLGPGTHTVRVKDHKNCWKEANVTIGADGSNLIAHPSAIIPDSECVANNGSLTIIAEGGTGPYQYQINSGGFGTVNIFNSLSDGLHKVVVKDSEECQTNLTVTVPRAPTGISFADDVEPIMTLHCNTTGCHGPGSGARDWTVFDNVKAKASRIKARTSDGTMPPVTPPALTPAQVKTIACWVDDGALNN